MAKKKSPKLPIEEGNVVGIYYTLLGEEGEVLDSNRSGGPPLAFLCGAGNIVPGLEKALLGKLRGDSVDVVVEPEEAYGVSQPQLVEDVPRENFPPDVDLTPGVRLHGRDGKGQPMQAIVLEVGDETVKIDRNHPFAGRKLRFQVDVAGVREAKPEERAHKHAHGPGGAAH